MASLEGVYLGTAVDEEGPDWIQAYRTAASPSTEQVLPADQTALTLTFTREQTATNRARAVHVCLCNFSGKDLTNVTLTIASDKAFPVGVKFRKSHWRTGQGYASWVVDVGVQMGTEESSEELEDNPAWYDILIEDGHQSCELVLEDMINDKVQLLPFSLWTLADPGVNDVFTLTMTAAYDSE